MEFTVNLYPYHRLKDIPSTIAFVQRAEALGFGTVYLPDHAAFPRAFEPSMGQPWWDAIVMAGLLAAKTRTIRIGFGVLILPQHNPLYLAKQLATLDEASEGRMVIGVGVGWLEGEFTPHRKDFRARGAMTDDYIRALKALWGADPCSFDGDHISFTDMVSTPKPVQKPHPPIVVGGSVKTSVRRAAELGDGWIPMGASIEEFEEGLSRLKQGLEERGRSSDGFIVSKGLPLYGMSAETEEHVRAAGTKYLDSLDGDYGKALELVSYCRDIGVTQMNLSLASLGPGNADERDLETFSKRVIERFS